MRTPHNTSYYTCYIIYIHVYIKCQGRKREKLHGRRIIYRLVFVFAQTTDVIASIKPSFRKHVRCPDVFGTVRSEWGYEKEGAREKRRLRRYIYTYMYMCAYVLVHNRVHTKIRYTEGLGSVSVSLLFSSRSVSGIVICFFSEVIIAEDSHFESSQQHQVIVRQWRSNVGSAIASRQSFPRILHLKKADQSM